MKARGGRFSVMGSMLDRSTRLLCVTLVLPALVSGCASLRGRDHAAGAGNVVLVNEPAIPDGAPPDRDVEETSVGADVVAAVSRLVANDGRVPTAVREYAVPWIAGSCSLRTLGATPRLLEEGGVYASSDPYRGAHSWVSIGLSFGRDGVLPASWLGTCGGPWLMDAAPARAGRLAPDVAGRDTSLLFTTRRVSMGRSGAAGVVGTVAEWLLPADGGGRTEGDPGGQPRTAKPRAAGDARPSTPTPPAAPHGDAPRPASGSDGGTSGAHGGWHPPH